MAQLLPGVAAQLGCPARPRASSGSLPEESSWRGTVAARSARVSNRVPSRSKNAAGAPDAAPAGCSFAFIVHAFMLRVVYHGSRRFSIAKMLLKIAALDSRAAVLV